MAVVLAKMEIQIEGVDGFAAKLPTWKIENKWTKLFYSGRPLTGYHLYLMLFEFLMIQLPFIVFFTWSLQRELLAISFLIFLWVIEDFIWFILNPAFSLKKFKPEYIWWHKKWLWFMPRDYWVELTLGIILYLFGTRIFF
jgi:hypothetical protein